MDDPTAEPGPDATPDDAADDGDDSTAMEVPARVDIQRGSGFDLTWSDGSVSHFGLEELRTACPCAACRGARDAGRQPWTPSPLGPALSVLNAELVGAWGITIHWSDGHSTGIYPWDVLQRWRPAS